MRRRKVEGTERRRAAGALALAIAAVALGPPAARAGDYHQVLCADPQTGEAIGGGMPDGMSFYTSRGQFSGGAQSPSACTGPNHRGLAIVAQDAGPWNDGDRASFHYTAPVGIVLEEGVIYRFRRADTRWGNRISSYQHSGPADFDGQASPANAREACNWANPGCFDSGLSSGYAPAQGGWNQQANRVEIVHSGGRWTYNMVCESQDQPTCTPSWAPQHYAYLYGGRMRLREEEAPTLLGMPSGSLRDDDVLRGTASATFSADDALGSGLYRLLVTVDGQRVSEEIVDSNGARCRDVNASNGNPYEYAFQRPCVRRVESRRVSLDTTRIAEGSHYLTVDLEDAAGNRVAVVPRRQVVVDNVPPPALVEGGEPSIAIDGGVATTGARALADDGTWSGEGNSYARQWLRCRADGDGCVSIAGADAAEYVIADADAGSRLRVRVTARNAEGEASATSAATDVVQRPASDVDPEPRESETRPADPPSDVPRDTRGAPNGSGASDRAVLSAAVAGRDRALVPFGSAAEVTGTLVSESGAAISGATLEVLSAVRRPGAAPERVATVTTDAGGRYRWDVPAGPSRALTIAYRARGGDAGHAAAATVELLVGSAARLRVQPGRVTNGQAVRFTGQMRGEGAPRRMLIVLEARVGRRWRPFANVRTGAAGRFAARYRFRATTRTRTYTFRARLPRHADWTYEAGTSNTVRVKVRARGR